MMIPPCSHIRDARATGFKRVVMLLIYNVMWRGNRLYRQPGL
jgi:hypothetical protein